MYEFSSTSLLDELDPTIETFEAPIPEEPDIYQIDSLVVDAQTSRGTQDARRLVDNQLVTAFQAGDKTAYSDLFRIHESGIRKMFMWLTKGDTAKSEDLAQETFIKVLNKLDTYQQGSFTGWLNTIARRTFVDDYRRMKRFTLLPEDYLPEEHFSIPSHENDCVTRIDAGALLGQIGQTILPEFLAAVLAVDYRGLSYREAAEELNTKVGTIRSRVSRGRAALSALRVEEY